MFATLLGGLPRPVGPDGSPIADDDAAVRAAIAAQLEAGLEPLTDGRLRSSGFAGAFHGLPGVVEGPDGPRLAGIPGWREPLTVASWRFATAAADGASAIVKQTLPGPYTLGRRLGPGDVDAATAAFAEVAHAELRALADAGCAFIEIEERDAHQIGTDPLERRRFARAHEQLLDGLDGVHVSLAILGGNADTAGVETILAAPYPSLAVDLIGGPDNWRLVRATPGRTGIVCGALATGAAEDEGPELLVWAAAYAASANGRGRDRVGLATADGLEHLPWEVAVRKMGRLGAAARLAAVPVSEAAEHLDPRSLDIRSAALGRYVRPEDRPRRARPPS
jgi:methionine synthase II (cobalamin-independent)